MQRATIGYLAVALAFNAATPFITTDPPWLSDVPVVFAIMMLLIIIGHGSAAGVRLRQWSSLR